MIEKLTLAEVVALDAGMCPDCGSRRFNNGPRAGDSVTIQCSGCGAKFNVVIGLPGSFSKQRIGRPEVQIDPQSRPIPPFPV